jgi:molecular chaperone GrpE
MSKKPKSSEQGETSAAVAGEATARTEGSREDAPALLEAGPDDERLGDLERELESARAEAGAATDRALRTLAEFDNYRRRTERDRDESVQRGRAEVLRDLLEVADNFDRALSQGLDGVPAPFLEGMRLVARGLHDVLDRRGVTRIDAEGQPFDPSLHEALTAVPSPDVAPNTVLNVVQAGYRFEDRVLRPAKVIVSMAAPPSPSERPESAEDS